MWLDREAGHRGTEMMSCLPAKSYLTCDLSVGEPGWVCENNTAVVRVFTFILHKNCDIQELVDAHSNL